MISTFAIIFLSIFLEALPFVLIGTLISSLLEVFMPADFLEKRFKTKKFHTYLLAGLIGIIFPVCECAIVPIMRRLIKKGMPLGLGITFMLATPIVNPVVLLSTFYAFGDLTMTIFRGVFGYIFAVIIGLLMTKFQAKQVLLETVDSEQCDLHQHHHADACCCKAHAQEYSSILDKLSAIISHTGKEVLDVGRFLLLGAFITAMMQTLIPRHVFNYIGSNVVIAVLIMMVMAFVLSLCSEADAFIASSFANQFPPIALLAFLIFGPMIDIKNTLMLTSGFKKSFVVRFVLTISAVVFIGILFVAAFVPSLL